MKQSMVVGVFSAALLAVAGVTAGDALKSGPQAGQGLGGPFDVRNSTGKNAGKTNCLV
jgi:hypothetical protein